MRITINGLEEVLDAVDDIKDMSHLEKSLGKACALIERSAKQKAPKDTGALRRSITSEVSGTTGVVFTPLEYAPYVEYGTGMFAKLSGHKGREDVPWHYQDGEGNWHTTSGQEPQPFMRPALEENRARILEIFKEGLR